MHKIFICFAAEDRYTIAEPLVYHLKNYGAEIWYDRYEMVLGDNRQEKNLIEGAENCIYAIAILSEHTAKSNCLMEELCILEERYYRKDVTIFPILYELTPDCLPDKLQWIKKLIFKEVNKQSGTREICNHVICKITSDLLNTCKYKSIQTVTNSDLSASSAVTYALLCSYQGIDSANLNSRITLLYAAYLTIIYSKQFQPDSAINMIAKIFERLFSETRLYLSIDYRELWLLENAICLLINYYLSCCTESNI